MTAQNQKLLIGLAALFFFAGANVLPTARNNRRGAIGKNLTRIIGLVSVAIFFAFLIYFAKYFTIFMESMR